MQTGEVKYNESLSEYCSWRVGGPAERLYKPVDLADCQRFVKSLAADEPIIWLGLGSNLLIRDGGIKGTVILTLGALNKISQIDTHTVRAEAGVSCGQLARYCARRGLVGGEFWVGIPGTVGGALAMNAGCGGSETWAHVQAVEVMDRACVIQTRTPDDFSIAYREVKGLQNAWFVAGIFQFKQGEVSAAQAEIHHHLDYRTRTQPTNQPSCGSVFRNPPGDYAGRLIEACGLKGFQLGGAQVSEKHANFIVNVGHATAADIEKLIQHVETCVAEKFGIQMIREVHIIGEPKASVVTL